MKLHSAIFYTHDINKAESFYRDEIGFSVEYRSGDRFISFIIGGSRLGIKKQTEEREVPGHQTLFIEVEDIKNFYKTIKDKKFNILKPLTQGKWATEFTILDPDGNKILFRGE